MVYRLSREDLEKHVRIEYKFVTIRRNRKYYELYNDLTTEWIDVDSIEEAIKEFNRMVDENIKKL